MINTNVQQTTISQIIEEEPDAGPREIEQKDNTAEEMVSFQTKFKISEQNISDLSILPFSESIKGRGILSKNIKQISRYLSKRMPQEQKEQIIGEYNNLVDKKYSDGLSLDEERHLKYVKWQVDRIYDAEVGENLDILERFTEGIETFSDEIDRLIKEFDISKKHREPFTK